MIKAFCRNCKGVRNHEVLHSKRITGDVDNYIFWAESYQIIECLGCENLSFRKVYADSEMVDYDDHGNQVYEEEVNIFPKYLSKGKEIEHKIFLPKKIRTIYEETVIALENKLFLLAAAGLRACIEAICINKKIKVGRLETMINSLADKGILTLSDSKLLHSIRFLGNDALHTGQQPDEHTVYLLFDIVNHTLESLYIKERKMKGSVYEIIEDFETFLKTIKNNIKEEHVGHLLLLSDIIGQSKRLIPKDKFVFLEKELIENITTGAIDFLIYNESEKKYTIIKKPKDTFDFSDLFDEVY